MIDAGATLTVEWVDLATVRMDDQEIDRAQVQFYANQFTGNAAHLAPPILNTDHTVRDGRHRLYAHMLVGRTHARCLIVKEESHE